MYPLTTLIISEIENFTSGFAITLISFQLSIANYLWRHRINPHTENSRVLHLYLSEDEVAKIKNVHERLGLDITHWDTIKADDMIAELQNKQQIMEKSHSTKQKKH